MRGEDDDTPTRVPAAGGEGTRVEPGEIEGWCGRVNYVYHRGNRLVRPVELDKPFVHNYRTCTSQCNQWFDSETLSVAIT